MTPGELKQLYEKLYFLEVDARDKIHSRLQLSLTLLLAVGSALLFLLQNLGYEPGAWTPLRLIFLIFFCGGFVILVVAAGFFIKAFHSPSYRFLPDSLQTARYKVQLEQTYEPYEQREKLVADALDKYITGYYIEHGAFNTRVNDRRSTYLHSCNGAIIAAAVALMAAYLVFHFGGLDRGRMKPAAEVPPVTPADVRAQQQRK